jgi:urea transport system ATP-binding protein
MAIVLVEQYFEFAWALADRVHVFKRGSVSLAGDKAQIDKTALQAAVSV